MSKGKYTIKKKYKKRLKKQLTEPIDTPKWVKDLHKGKSNETNNNRTK